MRLHHYVLLLCSLLSSPSMFFCTSASWTTFSQRTPTRTYTRTRTLSTLMPLHSNNFIPMHEFQIVVQTAVTLLLHLISCFHATFFNVHVAILMITDVYHHYNHNVNKKKHCGCQMDIFIQMKNKEQREEITAVTLYIRKKIFFNIKMNKNVLQIIFKNENSIHSFSTLSCNNYHRPAFSPSEYKSLKGPFRFFILTLCLQPCTRFLTLAYGLKRCFVVSATCLEDCGKSLRGVE